MLLNRPRERWAKVAWASHAGSTRRQKVRLLRRQFATRGRQRAASRWLASVRSANPRARSTAARAPHNTSSGELALPLLC